MDTLDPLRHSNRELGDRPPALAIEQLDLHGASVRPRSALSFLSIPEWDAFISDGVHNRINTTTNEVNLGMAPWRRRLVEMDLPCSVRGSHGLEPVVQLSWT